MLIEWIVALAIGLITIYPPLGCSIPMMVNSFLWVYLVIASGFIGCFLLYLKLNFFIKTLCVYLFLSCFFSSVPYISFNSYLVFIISVLFYFLAVNKCNFSVILKVIQAIFWFEVLMIIAQLCGKDTLINFDRPEKVFLGTVMQYMRCGSLFSMLVPFLMVVSKWYIIPVVILTIISKSSGFAISVGAGLFVYLFLTIKKKILLMLPLIWGVVYLFYDKSSVEIAFQCGRVKVWGKIIETALVHPIKGWGMGTFSTMFPIVIKETNPFQQAHNSFLQLWWEIGIIGVFLVGLYGLWLGLRLYKQKEYILISGLAVIVTNMFFAFPERMVQTCLLIIAFFALCERRLHYGNQQGHNCESCTR